jgi:hypothetical protein
MNIRYEDTVSPEIMYYLGQAIAALPFVYQCFFVFDNPAGFQRTPCPSL